MTLNHVKTALFFILGAAISLVVSACGLHINCPPATTVYPAPEPTRSWASGTPLASGPLSGFAPVTVSTSTPELEPPLCCPAAALQARVTSKRLPTLACQLGWGQMDPHVALTSLLDQQAAKFEFWGASWPS